MPYKDQFHMNKTTGELWLGPSIDREVVDHVHIIINATEDCWIGEWPQHNISLRQKPYIYCI